MSEEVKDEKKVIGAKYIGAGKFLFGVPAKDLTADEWLAFSELERNHFVNLGLFEVIYD